MIGGTRRGWPPTAATAPSGVVYDPSADRRGNWVRTTMGRRYDAFCYFDSTEALHALATGHRRRT